MEVAIVYIQFIDTWCNMLDESHRNERDLKTVKVRDYIVKDDLKKLIYIIYTNC